MVTTGNLERYREIARLGSGGMATVMLAEDTLLGRQVALKRLAGTSDVRHLSRLRREALIGASISHPNVVSIYDVLTPEGGDVVIVMEYVPGRTLRDALKRGPLPAREALRILTGVAAGLDAIHARGIVHRDVKPPNVLLGSAETVKLADLGIASVPDQTRITTAGTVLGSFSYMAPEQLEAAPATPAIDVYALAAVAFEALCGRKAREETNPMAVAHAMATQPPPDLRAAWPDAPAGASEVLKRAMARDPARRPRSAGELVARLRVALVPEDTRVATPGRAAGRRAARSRGALAAGAAAAAGAGAAAAGAAAGGRAPAAGAGAAAANAAAAGRAPTVARGQAGAASPPSPSRAPRPSAGQGARSDAAGGAAGALVAAPAALAAAAGGRVRPGSAVGERSAARRPAPRPVPAQAQARGLRRWLRAIPPLMLAAGAIAVVALLTLSGSPKPASRTGHAQSTGGQTTANTAKGSGAAGSARGTSSGPSSSGPSSSGSSNSGAASSGASSSSGSSASGGVAAGGQRASGAPALGSNLTPVSAVESFYGLAAAHKFPDAWALADPTFRSQLQGYASFEAGQANTQSILFNSARVVSQSAGSAVVAITTTSVQSTGTQHCSGTVDVASAGGAGGWLLHHIAIGCH